MQPGIYDLNLYRGDSARLRFVLWSDAAKTVPYDLTGAVAAAQIRDEPDGAVVVNLVCQIDLPNGIDATVPAVPAGNLRNKGVWDLQLTWPSGDVRTVVSGGVYAVPDVTRAGA